jgi:hypothetical protein
VRIRYEQTIGELKQMASQALGIPLPALQLFRHKRELTPAHDSK